MIFLKFDIVDFFSHPALAGICAFLTLLFGGIKYLITEERMKKYAGNFGEDLLKKINMKIPVYGVLIIITILSSIFYLAFNRPTVKDFQNTKLLPSLIEKSEALIIQTDNLIKKKILPIKKEIDETKPVNEIDVRLERKETKYLEVEFHLKSFSNSIHDDIAKYKSGAINTKEMELAIKEATNYLDSLSLGTKILN